MRRKPEDSAGWVRTRRGVGHSSIRRREVKFELEVASAAFLREELGRWLPLFEFVPGYPYTHVTTVYFDTEDRQLFRRAARSYDDNEKIRVKEYYYRGADGSYWTFPYCYVELKCRSRGEVSKRRLRVPKELVEGFLQGKDVREPALEMAAGEDAAAFAEIYDELQRYILRFEIVPASAIHYRRLVYQETEDVLRITFDDQIAVYLPPVRLYDRARALTPDALGRPVRRFDRVIAEVKCGSGEYPLWLREALRNHVSKPLSKFTESVSSLVEDEALRCARAESDAGRAGREAAFAADASPLEEGVSSVDDTQILRAPVEG